MFFSLGTAYTIDGDCPYLRKRRLRKMIDEAVFLYRRAAAVLREEAAQPQRGSPVDQLAKAVLGDAASPEEYLQIAVVFDAIITGVGVEDPRSGYDIRFFCTDQFIAPAQTGGSYMEKFDLRSLGLDAARVPAEYLSPDRRYLLIPISGEPGRDPYATTRTVFPGNKLYRYIHRIIPSAGQYRFSNIVVHDNLFSKEFVIRDKAKSIKDFSPTGLRGIRYNIRDYRNTPGSMAIMHELIHSVANPNPKEDHAVIIGGVPGTTGAQRDANYWLDVTLLARSGTDRSNILTNPGTLVWLAF
ncbi:hypothetical protein GP486_001148, partial [Trichoglossum hirsutum]